MMNNIERRIYEQIMILFGDRGAAGKRAVRLEEFDQVATRTMRQIADVKTQADQQGVAVDDVLVKFVALNEKTDGIVENFDEQIADVREDFDSLLLDTDEIKDRLNVVEPEQREIEDRIDQLASSVATGLNNILFNTERLSDAGIFVDPQTGEVRIFGIEALENQFSEVSIELDAAKAQIELKASVAYVNQAISDLVLDPTQIPLIDDLEVRITNAEVSISGFGAAIDLKADFSLVDGINTRVGQAEVSIDALEGAINLKVDQADFDDVSDRLTDAEIELSAIDGASFRLSLVDQRNLFDDIDTSAFSSLQELWLSYESREALRTGIAFAETQIYARVDESLFAEAEARNVLAAKVEDSAADIVRLDRVVATNDIAIAGEVQEIRAAIRSQGTSVLTDQFLELSDEENWSRVDAQGELTRPENTVYRVGLDWRFVVSLGQRDGFMTRSDRPIWRGAKNSAAYVIEVDFTLEQGSIEGAGAWFEWVNADGSITRSVVRLDEASSGPVQLGQVMTAQAYIEHETSPQGTFSFNRLYFWANRNDSELGNAAKTIRFHRVSVRTATDSETKISDVEAAVTQESIARATEWNAVATSIQGTEVDFDGLSAGTQIVAASIANLEKNASSLLALRVKAGSAGAALELVAADGPNGPVSTARVSANDIILNGSVTAAQLSTSQLISTSAQIGDALITRAKIEDAAINEAKIANGSITSAKIGDAQITSAKIGEAAITSAKLAGTIQSDIFTGGANGVGWRIQRNGDAQFGTLALRNNAVSQNRSASGSSGNISGTPNYPTGYQTIASLSYTPFSSDTVTIFVWDLTARITAFGSQGAVTASSVWEYLIEWRGNVVSSGTISGTIFADNNTTRHAHNTDFGNTIITSPGSGGGTLRIRARVLNAGPANRFSTQITSSRISSLEFKR